ncbi:MAG: PEP/pyruvate-binding domain-containing protein [Candidatus Abyssubacteria bacterium]
MRLLDNIFKKSKEARLAKVRRIQEKFSIFQALLERHNEALKLISRLEEKQQGGQLNGVYSLWDDFVQIQEGVREVVERMIDLGGEPYIPLRSRLQQIVKEVENCLPDIGSVTKDDYIVPFGRLSRDRALSVGPKAANLGEMKSLGLPVPDGFAISAWAYQHFIDANNLQERVNKLLAQVRIRRYEDLKIVSEDIREMVNFRSVPEDLANAILEAFDQLTSRNPHSKFALRSSAVGEDTSFTFAGQYTTFLNVSRDALLDRYKDILASKFTPSAISYLMRHSLSEMDLAMGVICMEMVDAAASGVVYTRDPLNPSSPYLMVNSIFGLGSYLVEGELTPDVFHVSRDDRKVTLCRIARKPVQLIPKPEGGVMEVSLPETAQEKPSLDEGQLATLAAHALKLEEHYGQPLDIEWALDRSGEIFLLQARPLKLLEATSSIRIPDDARSLVLLDGGTPICSGLGMGPVFHLSSISDMDQTPDGAVLISSNPSPKLVSVMHRIGALVTLVGGTASHLATLARELSVPTIAGMPEATTLEQGREVTVDAEHGTIYDGLHPEWMPEQKQEAARTREVEIPKETEHALAKITHLCAVHPNDPTFTLENCHSMHDILRFAHQKSMEEIFSSLKGTSRKDDISLRLKTKIPLLINIIYLDQNYLDGKSRKWVQEDAIESLPMKAFWEGILQEGWPERAVPADLKGFLAVVGTDLKGAAQQPEFSENSYAFLGREYMLLSLRMGYHFSTIEALATPEPSKNYIRMQFKLGGAPLERRIRRIWLLCELLRRIGFENFSEGDFLDTTLSYQGREETLECLRLLGRITILTKQLDLTLSSDARARWYRDDFLKRLGLEN